MYKIVINQYQSINPYLGPLKVKLSSSFFKLNIQKIEIDKWKNSKMKSFRANVVSKWVDTTNEGHARKNHSFNYKPKFKPSSTSYRICESTSRVTFLIQQYSNRYKIIYMYNRLLIQYFFNKNIISNSTMSGSICP